ncbi:MAG TPA: hypothetical protein VHY08_01845 [Bacillota bacterium]|nr:hypothetical protein [Bacillota bacterium]
MKCEQFDEVRNLTMAKYGGVGVKVELLSESDHHVPTPPGDWLTVTVKVTPVVPNPEPWAEEWYYGGFLHSTKKPVPLGVRPIDNQKLKSCVEVAKNLPIGFPLPEASCNLFWPLVPSVTEPLYQFVHGETVINIGGYTGEIRK